MFAPFGGAVPITFQTLGVMLAGAILGWKRGALAVIVFFALATAGLPLVAGGRGGLALWVSPSAGYFVGWIVGAGVIGWLVQSRLPRYAAWWTFISIAIGGIGVVYAIGIPVLMLKLGTGLAALGTAATFIPGDLIKAVVATVVAAAVHRAFPDLPSPLRSARPRDSEGTTYAAAR
jgi:biotin transport system substrate-specific component